MQEKTYFIILTVLSQASRVYSGIHCENSDMMAIQKAKAGK